MQSLSCARDDDYFFGVLTRESIRFGPLQITHGTVTVRRARPTYKGSDLTFETFPFPWPPGQEPKDDPRVKAIAEAAEN